MATDKNTMKQIQSELLEEAKRIGAKYGLGVEPAVFHYGAYGDVKFTFATVRDGVAETQDVLNLKYEARTHQRDMRDGSKPSWAFLPPESEVVGFMLKRNGQDYGKLVGFKPQSRKFPYLIEKTNGQVYKTTVEAVKLGVLEAMGARA